MHLQYTGEKKTLDQHARKHDRNGKDSNLSPLREVLNLLFINAIAYNISGVAGSSKAAGIVPGFTE